MITPIGINNSIQYKQTTFGAHPDFEKLAKRKKIFKLLSKLKRDLFPLMFYPKFLINYNANNVSIFSIGKYIF